MNQESHAHEEHRVEIVRGDGFSHEHEHTDHEEEGFGSKVLKFLIVVGILIILLIASIGIVRIVPKVIAKLSNATVFLGTEKPAQIVVTTDKKSVVSENFFLMSWKSDATDENTLSSVSFKCVSGISIQYKSTSGMKNVICDTVFPLPNTKEGSFPFLVSSLLNKKETLPFVVSVTEKTENKILASGSSSVDVYPKGSTEIKDENIYSPDFENPFPSNTKDETNINKNPTNTTSRPSQTQSSTKTEAEGGNYSGGNYVQETGNPDLLVTLISVHVTDKSTGQTGNQNSVSSNDRVTARFRVANIGSRSSGIWTLQAQIPSANSYERNYTSSYQPNLTPGSIYDMVLSFDTYDGSGDLSLTAISRNDTNQNNNNISIALDGDRNTGNSGGGDGSRPDLIVRITDIGISRDGKFYHTNNFDENDEIAVKFIIENQGGRDSTRYSFKAEIPSQDDDTYESGTYSSLSPNQKREFMIVIDNPDSGRSRIEIEVDPDNDVRESKENNNTDSESIDIDN